MVYATTLTFIWKMLTLFLLPWLDITPTQHSSGPLNTLRNGTISPNVVDISTWNSTSIAGRPRAVVLVRYPSLRMCIPILPGLGLFPYHHIFRFHMICCWELVVKTGFHRNLCVVVVRRSRPSIGEWSVAGLARKMYYISSNSTSDGMKVIIQVIQLYTLVKSTTNRLYSTPCPNFRSCRWQVYYLGRICTQDCQTITSASEYGHPHSISGCSLLHHLAFHRNIDSPLTLKLTVSPISTNASFFLSLTDS